jgi:hypothetical protein
MTFKKETTVPIVDFPESYGYKKVRVMMSPKKFMELAKLTATQQKYRDENIISYMRNTTYPNSVERAKVGLLDTRPLVPTPYLEFKDGKIKEHEGRNRAMASLELGRKQIPVYLIWFKEDIAPPKDLDKVKTYW